METEIEIDGAELAQPLRVVVEFEQTCVHGLPLEPDDRGAVRDVRAYPAWGGVLYWLDCREQFGETQVEHWIELANDAQDAADAEHRNRDEYYQEER